MSTPVVIGVALVAWFAVSVAFVATCGQRLAERLRDRQPPPNEDERS